MKPMLLFAAKTLALISALSLAGFYVWYTQRQANPSPSTAQEMKDFEGSIHYGEMVEVEGVDAQGKPVTFMLGSKSISQPVFSMRNVAPWKQAEVHFVKRPLHGLLDYDMTDLLLMENSPPRKAAPIQLSGSKSLSPQPGLAPSILIELDTFIAEWTKGWSAKSHFPSSKSAKVELPPSDLKKLIEYAPSAPHPTQGP